MLTKTKPKSRKLNTAFPSDGHDLPIPLANTEQKTSQPLKFLRSYFLRRIWGCLYLTIIILILALCTVLYDFFKNPPSYPDHTTTLLTNIQTTKLPSPILDSNPDQTL